MTNYLASLALLSEDRDDYGRLVEGEPAGAKFLPGTQYLCDGILRDGRIREILYPARTWPHQHLSQAAAGELAEIFADNIEECLLQRRKLG